VCRDVACFLHGTSLLSIVGLYCSICTVSAVVDASAVGFPALRNSGATLELSKNVVGGAKNPEGAQTSDNLKPDLAGRHALFGCSEEL